MTRSLRILALAAVGVAAVLLLLRPARSGNSPPVVIVTIDTMRADAAGGGRGTPALESFLAGARDFRAARAPVPLTLPSHVSLFSGLMPVRHRIHDNAAPPIPKERGYPLLAEEFRDAGYATAAFTAASVVAAHTGLAEGFDVYEGVEPPSRYVPGRSQIAAEERLPAALAWLRAHRDGPFFLWVHFYDPHRPYLPFAGDGRRPPAAPEASEAERYAGEVRRVDAAMEALLAEVPEGAIVVVASDHGESLGEHGESTHGALCYSCTLDVFLAVRGPGMAPGSVDDGPRGLCAIAPTLRAWCGLPSRRADSPALFEPPSGPVVSESLLAWRQVGWGQCFAVSDGRHVLVESGPRVEVFDRAGDPGERAPKEPIGHEAYPRLDTALAEMRALATTPSGPEYVPDAASPYGAARRPLTHYLPRAENAKLTDPVTQIGGWEELEELGSKISAAIDARDRDTLFAAMRRLEELIAESPGNPAPFYYLAEVQRDLGTLLRNRSWHRDAARSAREAMERGYLVPALVYRVLEQSLLAGTPEDWRTGLEAAAKAEIVPDLICAQMALQVAQNLRAAGDGTAAALATSMFDRVERHFPDGTTRRHLDDMRAELK